MTPLIGFSPDLDPATPGIVTDCSSLVPTVRGMAAEKSPVVISEALPATCYGMASVLRQDGAIREFAGTNTNLYELSGTAWTNRSKTGGYLNGDRWRFTQFGNASLATDFYDPIQVSTGLTSNFDDLAKGSVTAPAAKIIETVAGFVMAFNTKDAGSSPVYGTSPDRWWCSALYDHTDWTPSVTTQCATGRFIDSPGPITAAKRLGDNIIVYKEKSMYIGSYQGPPIIWAWQQVSSEVGCLSADGIVNIGTAHIFFGTDNFWLFDGSRPVEIGAPIRMWWLANSAASQRSRMQAQYDRKNGLVRFYYVSSGSNSTALDGCLVYHVPTNRWGRANKSIQAAADVVSPGVLYNDFGSFGGGSWTYDTLPDVLYDSDIFMSMSGLAGVVNDSKQLCSLSGTPGTSTFLTGDYGDDNQYSSLKRVRGHFLTLPVTGTLGTSYRADAGANYSVNAKTANINGSKFDILQQGRWHRGLFTFTGSCELTAIEFQLEPRGYR
jgi:hypothetical protein